MLTKIERIRDANGPLTYKKIPKITDKYKIIA